MRMMKKVFSLYASMAAISCFMIDVVVLRHTTQPVSKGIRHSLNRRRNGTAVQKVSSSNSCWHLSQDITSTTFYRILSARRYILVHSYRQILGKIISMLNLVFSLQAC
ncbi:hypothetical protein V6Z11_D03G105700 [Gossypium hirsutum]